jgi:hypothetical protein
VPTSRRRTLYLWDGGCTIDMDENKTNFDPEIYLAGITDQEGRARTRRENCWITGREEDGSGPEAQLNTAIYRADREPPRGAQPSLEYPVAMSLPQDDNIYEVDFTKFDPRCPRPHFRHRSHAYFERRLAEIETEGKLRPAVLTREVVKAYRAISYCNWQFGTLLTCFLTVSYDALGLFDQREAMQVHSELNKKIGNLLRGSTVRPPRRRFHRTPMSRSTSCPHTYVWMVENPRDKGFHGTNSCMSPQRRYGFRVDNLSEHPQCSGSSSLNGLRTDLSCPRFPTTP